MPSIQYVEDNKGLDSEQTYLYHTRDLPCKNKPEFSAVNGTGFRDIDKQERSLMKAVASVGPVTVAINVSCRCPQFYFKKLLIMKQNAALKTWIMEFWWLAMALK